MYMPTYKGVIEDWKVELITARAKLMGFRSFELPDVLQVIVMELLQFEYAPDHQNGASESTALTQVIDNSLRNMKRSAARYDGHVKRMGEMATDFSRDEVDLRSMDLAHVIAGLTSREQAVCRGLADGLTIAEMATRLHASWHTIEQIMIRLRDRFEEIGLNGWVDE